MPSTTKLTPEQERFYKLMLVRATSADFGQPYIAYALFELTPVNAPNLGTLAVDKYWRVYVDFDFVMEKGIEWAAGVLNHEPWHLLRDHLRRFEALDALPGHERHNAKIWNISGDLTINGDIPTLVPEDGCFPAKGMFSEYALDRAAEDYYRQMMADEKINPPRCPECGQPETKEEQDKRKKDEQEKKDKADKGDKSEDKGDKSEDKSDESGDDEGDSDDAGDQDGDQPGEDGTPGDDGQGDPNAEGETDKPGDGKGTGETDQEGDGNGTGETSKHGNGNGTCSTCGHDKPGQGQGQGDGQGQGQGGLPDLQCGSGAGNKLKDYELGEDGAPSVDEERADQIRQAVAQDMRQYEASNPGKLPGGMKVWADAILESKPVDWRALLRGQIKKQISSWTKGKMDYRRNRPNRRQPSREILYPALQAPKPRLALAIDTSGSHLHKLPVVVEQVQVIVKQVGVRGKDLLAFGVDVALTDVKPVNDPKKVLDDMTGGGGTDMAVGMEQLGLLGRRGKADIGIMLTDLQTGWPAQKPEGNMRYIVCGIVNPNNKWEMEWVDRAEAAISDWAEVVVIEVEDQ